MKFVRACAAVLLVLVIAHAVWAQDKTTPTVDKALGLGVGLKLDMAVEGNDQSEKGDSQDMAFGIGFGLVADYQIMEYFKAGLDLMYYSVKADAENVDRGGILVFGPRMTGGYTFDDFFGWLTDLYPYGFVTVGLGYVIPGNEAIDPASGLWLQFGAGAEARFAYVSAFLEISYGFDFYSLDYAGQSTSHTYGSIHIGLGSKWHF